MDERILKSGQKDFKRNRTVNWHKFQWAVGSRQENY